MKYLKSILLIIILVILDQLSKFYFINRNIKIFSFFSLTFVKNTGVSFGLFKGYNLIFILLTLLVIATIIYNYKKYPKSYLAFNLILAGAIGNLIDRIFRGFVIDFIDFNFWPVFNLADSLIVIGALILIYNLIKEK